MTSIPKITLEDTLYLVQLARETAQAQGRQAQASRLTPVSEEMRTLVTRTHQPAPSAPPSMGMLGQADFQKMLEVAQTRPSQPQAENSVSSAMERNRLISAMASANMSDVDIARQFGMTRDEVRLVLNVQQRNSVRGISHD